MLKNLSFDYTDSSVGHASQRTEVNHQQTHHDLSTQNPIHCSRSDIGLENEVRTHRRNLSDQISEDWAAHTYNFTQPATFTLLSLCREVFNRSSESIARLVGTPAMVDVRKASQIRFPKWKVNVGSTSISSMSDAHTPAFTLQHTFLIPAHVSTLTYTQNGMLILGSGMLLRPLTGCAA